MVYTEGRLRPGVAASIVAIAFGILMIAVLLNFKQTGPSLIVFFLLLLVAIGILLWSSFGRRRTAVTGELRERPATVVNIDEERAPPTPLAAETGPHARLRELEDMRRDGLLTHEEYVSKRRELLDSKW